MKNEIEGGRYIMSFPKDFLWGTATSSVQIEGGYLAGGRTPSIWDNPPQGKVKGDANPQIASDHYTHWREDLALLKELGVKSYRFSLSWSRIMPSPGQVNKEGIKFYQNIIDELRRLKIDPLITIYHWDLPLWVHKLGGWLSPKIVKLFAEYTKVVVDAYSDKVQYWIPLNEPQPFIMNGYMIGKHAPFKFRPLALPKLTRHCLTAFNQSAAIIRKYAKTPPKVGIAMAAGAFIPEDESEKAIATARHKSFYHKGGLMSNRWWSDPLVKGKRVRAYGIYSLKRRDMRAVQTKLDFMGINNYSPFQANWHSVNENISAEQKNCMGWVNDGRALYWTIRFFAERYKLPLIITENGTCDHDVVVSGQVNDTKRVKYMQDYLANLKRAVNEGYEVLGYQYWSFLDNFEWAEGYGPRFGLVHIDYETQKRTMKQSAYFYKEVIKTNGENI